RPYVDNTQCQTVLLISIQGASGSGASQTGSGASASAQATGAANSIRVGGAGLAGLLAAFVF
nr:hypothetical protein [Tanacetum cinerariifolium]